MAGICDMARGWSGPQTAVFGGNQGGLPGVAGAGAQPGPNPQACAGAPGMGDLANLVGVLEPLISGVFKGFGDFVGAPQAGANGGGLLGGLMGNFMGAGGGPCGGDVNGASGAGNPQAAQASCSASAAPPKWGKAPPESVQMPITILQNVILSKEMSAQDKGDIKKCIDNVKKGENLDSACNSLSVNQRTVLVTAIASAGFKPPECLKQYSKNPAKDYAPGRMDCALRNVEVGQKTGSYKNTQADQLTNLIPIFGPMVSKVLNVGLGITANLQSQSQGLGAAA